MKRRKALKKIKYEAYNDEIAKQDMAYIADKLDISVLEFKQLMSGENKSYRDYKNNYWIIKIAIKIAMFLGVEKRNFR